MKTINATMDMLTVLLMLFSGRCIGGDSIVVYTALIQGSVVPQLLVVVVVVVVFVGDPSAHKYNLWILLKQRVLLNGCCLSDPPSNLECYPVLVPVV